MMTDKFRITEWLGGGEPIVTVMCSKADWFKMVRAEAELAAREAELVETKKDIEYWVNSVECWQKEVLDRDARIVAMAKALEEARKGFNNLIDYNLLPSKDYHGDASRLSEMCWKALSGKESDE